MAKFKKGQLVELIKSVSGNLGHRFIITTSKLNSWVDNKFDGDRGYKTDIKDNGNDHRYFYAPESFLKIVKPDSYELSEFSFSELMININTNNTIKEK